MKKVSKKDKQTKRLIKWIEKNPGWWKTICTPGNMNIEKMKMITQKLAQEQMYDIILVLVTVHRNEDFMKNAFNYMFLDLVKENCSKKDMADELLKVLE